MRLRQTLFAIFALGALSPSSVAQDFLLSRTSGNRDDSSRRTVRPIGLRGRGADRKMLFGGAAGQFEVPISQILGLHGTAPEVTSPVAVHLVGGDELKGRLLGGDEGGNTFSLRSPALAGKTIPVDRLATLIFRQRAPFANLEDFAIDAAADYSEALFRRVLRGFDEVPVKLDCFSANRIRFGEDEDEPSRSLPYSKLSAIAIRDGDPAENPGPWILLTTAGDRLRVELSAISPKAFVFQTEFGPVTLPHAKVAGLSLLAEDRTYLSDMSPIRVVEQGSVDDGAAVPLYSYRRDRTVSGGTLASGRSPTDGFLVVDGRSYAKGLGVHSRCLLTYRVPKGVRFFHAQVAIDDEVKNLAVKGIVDVVVRMGKQRLWERRDLRCGGAPVSLGLLPVEPGKLLVLEVDFGKALFVGDRVDWLSAVFLR